MHILISDGRISDRTLKLLGKDEAWLSKTLRSHSLNADEIYLMTSDDLGNLRIFTSDSDGEIIKIEKKPGKGKRK